MSQSIEHKFVTDQFLKLAEELSKSQLYGFREADRGRLDFACSLATTKARLVSGQTLKRHAEGIEKDLNLLILGETLEIPIYIYAHSAKNEARIQEVLTRFADRHQDRLTLLRLFRYPANFDADNEAQRSAVTSSIKEQIACDLLLNVLFGRFSQIDIDLFLTGTTLSNVGISLVILDYIAKQGFMSYRDVYEGINRERSISTIKQNLRLLVGAGMLDYSSRRDYRASQRARIFLLLCKKMDLRANSREVGSELAYIARHLGLDESMIRNPWAPHDKESSYDLFGDTPHGRTARLIFDVNSARDRYGLVLADSVYPEDPRNLRQSDPTGTHWICR